MQTVFIKFPTAEDRARGFYELATRARVSSFPGEVYQVAIDALRILDDQQVRYRRATDAEVKAAHDQIRNPTPAVIITTAGQSSVRSSYIRTISSFSNLALPAPKRWW